MKRRYWIRGRDRARRNWLVWLAVPGLIAAYMYGALMLVPQVEPDALAPQEVAEVRRSSSVESAAVDAIVVDRDLGEPPRSSTAETDVLPASDVLPEAESEPDACVAAMAAALSNARIEFLSSSAEIVPASRNVISVLAALAHACSGRIQIAGHSDNLGPEVINQQISLARAESVASAFIEFGVEPDRLTLLGLGSTQPVADNTTREGRARNRRIEMSLVE